MKRHTINIPQCNYAVWINLWRKNTIFNKIVCL